MIFLLLASHLTFRARFTFYILPIFFFYFFVFHLIVFFFIFCGCLSKLSLAYYQFSFVTIFLLH